MATRELLAKTALRLFAERGYAATSTRAIALAAGVSEGLVFHHYRTKLDLLLGVVSHHDILAGRVQALLAEAQTLPVRAMVAGVVSGFVETMRPDRQESRLFRVLVSESLTLPELGEVFRGTGEAVTGALVAYLQAQMEEGALRADLDPQSAAGSLIGPLFWFFVTHQHLSSRAWRAQARAYGEEVAQHWLRAVLAEPRAPE